MLVLELLEHDRELIQCPTYMNRYNRGRLAFNRLSVFGVSPFGPIFAQFSVDRGGNERNVLPLFSLKFSSWNRNKRGIIAWNLGARDSRFNTDRSEIILSLVARKVKRNWKWNFVRVYLWCVYRSSFASFPLKIDCRLRFKKAREGISWRIPGTILLVRTFEESNFRRRTLGTL